MKRLLPVALAVLIFAGLSTAQVIVRAGGAAATGCASIADGGIVCAGDQTFPPGIKTLTGVVSSQASGSNAYAVSTNGARYDFGAGANDYCSSDGTTVTFAGAIATTATVTVSGAGANNLTLNGSVPQIRGNAGDRMAWYSNAIDGVTSSSVAGITLVCTGTLTTGDLIFDVQDHNNTSRFSLGQEGAMHLNGDAGTTGLILTSNGAGAAPYWSTGQLLSDGGTLTTEPLTATFPLCIYDDGGTVNLSLSLDGGPCP